jgi:hypothetical protein
MHASSLSRALVLLLLRFLQSIVGVVEVDCLIRCLLWRLVRAVCRTCFRALSGARARRVGGGLGKSCLVWVSMDISIAVLASKR